MFQAVSKYTVDDEDSSSMVSKLHEWEAYYGFSSEIYVGYQEFCDNEFQDTVYMQELLSKKEYAKYLKERK